MPRSGWGWGSGRREVQTSPGLGAVVRGGWTGFVVLFLGDLVTLYHGRGDGLILYWVAVAAYAVAGNRAAGPSAGVVRTAARDGAGAATGAYLLTIPLREAAHDSITLLGTAVALVAAVVVGGAAGAIAARAGGRHRSQPAGAGLQPAPPPVGGGAVIVAGRWPHQRDVLELTDGRRLQWITAGPADGLALVLHHATPGALGAWRGAVGAAAEAGMRVVVFSRPGYGGSSARPGRRVVHTAADVAALLDHLGAEHFVTVGWSGGGPHALACAAELPGRCLAAAALACPAPPGVDGLDWADWLAGVDPDRTAEWELAQRGSGELERALVPVATGLRGLGRGELLDSIGEAMAEVDQRCLATPFADYVASTYQAGLASGVAGWRDDDVAVAGPWGFDPRRLDVPVGLWWGTADVVVPPAHGRWMSTHLRGVQGHEHAGEGHLSIVPAAFAEVVDSLSSGGRR